MVIVPPGPEVLLNVNDWLAEEVPTVCDAKVRDAGRNVAVNAAGTVAVISLDLGDSLAVCQAPPPVPVPPVDDAKVKVDEVGWLVEFVVTLKLELLLPPTVNVDPVGKEQEAVQVTVATEPLPEMLETIPPT